ncbi:MAG: pirin family protein [Phenylobacterium sp.]|jgi:redox-sensitive bicupin YhaK (pirin superfamily)|uniref:pirin family protein n=1 Tax=Phenylobacterium sp. TaxID=1871053 RepID=UPI002A36AE76|nr:pirin family protein [Phenylobacterium sp.]MDX9997278.1 pirin family protein [Phenylobacterium sp.]
MIDLVIDQRRKDLGGFEVGRVLPYARRRMVGPFIFFDHMGPADFAPGFGREVDVRPHPHIGLSTISYLFEGEMTHRDSVGVTQPIRPGEVNWMTAGRGITHSERFETLRARGGRMNGIQTWVALPQEDEETDPSFAHHEGDDLPTYEGDGLFARLIAGEAFGAKAAVKTHSPMFYVHWALQDGVTAALPAEYPERAAYVAQGRAEVDGRTFHEGQMLVFAPGETVTITAVGGPAIVMLLGGEPVGPRFIEWNFVSSSKERLEQAKADWRAGRMKLPDADNAEFIPLPPEPAPPPNPMS